MRLDALLPGKIVLCGVGCLGRGDDGFGPLLARRLCGTPGLEVLDCGDRLEDYTLDVARAEPDTVLVADAVDLHARPGDVALLGPDALPRAAGDTHRASLRVAMEYLGMRTGAKVLLLGVQPAVLTDRDELSPELSATLERVAEILTLLAADRACAGGRGAATEEHR
jgi:hydrogenase maturation protease